MEILLVAVDAQYIHTNLAVRSIAAYARERGGPCPGVAEFTINQRADAILANLAQRRADVYLFSCYIWNIELVCEVAASLRKLLPNVLIGAGGPEVSYNSEAFLRINPAFEFVLAGEGEAACYALFCALYEGQSWEDCPGIVSLSGISGISCGEVRANPQPALLEMDELAFPYDNLSAMAGRIVYYESMRGCPFGCAFCLSSTQRGVRYKSVEKTEKELALMLAARPAQVKFVDRSFNASPRHALAVWRFLQRQDNGYTNFHFELAGELITDEMLAFLASVRPGLFQFEIGVQSANTATLREVGRSQGTELLFERIASLRAPGNIHLHLDLIAGLPHEGYKSFGESFDAVYALLPHQMQLGFLKVLHGCEMQRRAAEFGLVWRDKAPYEVLYTRWLSFEELARLNGIARMVEMYHNSGRFSHIIAHLCACFSSAFAFYEALFDLFKKEGYEERPLSKLGYYDLLGEFMLLHKIPQSQTAQWLCRYDMLLHEKPRGMPAWVKVDGATLHRREAMIFYESEENVRRYLPQYAGREAKQMLRMAHIEVFPFDCETGVEGHCAILFDYESRDVTGCARWQRVSLKLL